MRPGRQGRGMDEGAKVERSEGQGSGLVSCPRVTRVKTTS